MENKTAFLLLIIGGIILFLEGITGSIGFFVYLPMILAIPEMAPLEPVIFYLIWILTIIAASGGIGVIIGALLFYASDLILAANRFWRPWQYNRISLGFYYSGQLLIALSAHHLIV